MNELEIKQAQISSLLESLQYQINPNNESAFDLLQDLEMAFDDLNSEIDKLEEIQAKELQHGKVFSKAS